MSAGVISLVAVTCLLVPSSGAHPPTPVAASAAKHMGKQRKPHRQALRGPISKSKVKVIKIIIRGGKGGAIAAGDDYPAQLRNAPMDSIVDQFGEYNRECTSFVAWALYSRNGFKMPFHDNANEWGPDAQKRGYLVNSTPAVGSVAWSNAGKWGHVAYVVAVNGSNITIEEYNEHFNGTYDKRTVPVSAFTGYIHFKDPSVTIIQSQAPPPPTQPAGTQTVTQTVTTTTPTTTTTSSAPRSASADVGRDDRWGGAHLDQLHQRGWHRGPVDREQPDGADRLQDRRVQGGGRQHLVVPDRLGALEQPVLRVRRRVLQQRRDIGQPDRYPLR